MTIDNIYQWNQVDFWEEGGNDGTTWSFLAVIAPENAYVSASLSLVAHGAWAWITFYYTALDGDPIPHAPATQGTSSMMIDDLEMVLFTYGAFDSEGSANFLILGYH